MNVILNIDSQTFSFNGIPSFKNFMPHVIGDKLAVVNVYDSKLKLCDYEEVSQFTVNGVVHTTMSNLATALLPVLYTRSSLGMISGTTNWGDIEGDVLDQTDLIDLLALNFYPRSSNPNGYLTSANWGSIAGSISSQTDLIALLNKKQNNPLYLAQVDDFSLLNTTAQQRIFSGGADSDGARSIVAGTRYLVYVNLNIIDLPAIAKNLSFGFLGTSACVDLSIFVLGVITNNTGTASITLARVTDYGGAIVTQSSASNFGRILGFGVLECTASGTLIPAISSTTGGLNGAKTKRNSVFTCVPLGPNTSSHNDPL